MELAPLPGRCVSCGFLAKFDLDHAGPPPYMYEMPTRDRETGLLSGIRLEKNSEIMAFPQCYRNIFDMWDEISYHREEWRQDVLAIKAVLDYDRRCAEWCRYTPGFSPPEHLKELRRQTLDRKRQEFEERMAREYKEFTYRLEKRHRIFHVCLAIVLGLFVVVVATATFLQLAFPNGWPWLMELVAS